MIHRFHPDFCFIIFVDEYNSIMYVCMYICEEYKMFAFFCALCIFVQMNDDDEREFIKWIGSRG